MPIDPELEKGLQRQLPALESFARRRVAGVVGRKESAEDVVQSVCREFLEHAEDGRFSYENDAELAQWLRNSVAFKIQNRYRYWGAERRDAARDVTRASSGAGGRVSRFAHPGGTPSEQVGASEMADLVHEALRELPERYAEVIRYSRFERLSHAEIGERMGISERASRMLLSRALARLSVVMAWAVRDVPEQD